MLRVVNFAKIFKIAILNITVTSKILPILQIFKTKNGQKKQKLSIKKQFLSVSPDLTKIAHFQ